MDGNEKYAENKTSEENNDDLSPVTGLEATVITTLGTMIIITIIGNILVCLSVVMVKKLRHPSNYLLVSLAISDLCVALLVMPLALYQEVSPRWGLGQTVCNMWVSFDVTCCTASILNLCTISIDRYLSITRPLTYGVNATAKRSFCFIIAIWIASCLISVPPLLLFGNEHGSLEEPECQVSQNIIYQLYATLGAFYIPLLVMILMYYKIYAAAKRVVEAELKAQPSRSSPSVFQRLLKKSRSQQKQKCSSPVNCDTSPGDHHMMSCDRNDNTSPLSIKNGRDNRKSRSTSKKGGKGQELNCSNSSSPPLSATPSRIASIRIEAENGLSVVSTLCRENAASLNEEFVRQHNIESDEYHEEHLPQHHHHNHNQLHLEEKTSSPLLSSKRRNNNLDEPPHVQTSKSRGGSSSALRERKASITLGVIMTAFTVCWLPFFILALLRPFSQSVYSIPGWIVSFALWLGYANSMLNPIIYVTFHQDFRKAFRYLLCLQCSTMGTRLREEAYQSQYGPCEYYSHPSVPHHPLTSLRNGSSAERNHTIKSADHLESSSGGIMGGAGGVERAIQPLEHDSVESRPVHVSPNSTENNKTSRSSQEIARNNKKKIKNHPVIS